MLRSCYAEGTRQNGVFGHFGCFGCVLGTYLVHMAVMRCVYVYRTCFYVFLVIFGVFCVLVIFGRFWDVSHV